MIYSDIELLESLTSPVRELGAQINIYNADEELILSTTEAENIKNIKIEKTGIDGKFFGYGVSQKLIVSLIDTKREIEVDKNYYIEVLFSVNNTAYNATPYFYIDDFSRDENTNDITITAYDLFYSKAQAHTVAELGLETYTQLGLLEASLELLGVSAYSTIGFDGFDEYEYTSGANFDGTETIKDVLNALAEVSQSIYYLNYENKLIFKRLSNDSEVDFTINKKDYFTLKSGSTYTLTGITNATELGDNVGVTSEEEAGVVAYIRDNPLWELREDVAELVDTALNNMCGLYITEFNCEWRGIFYLEPGDKIKLINKDDTAIISYLSNDSIEFNGGLKQITSWAYAEDNRETESNPTSLGEVLNKTTAKVDKVNREITLVASKTDENERQIAEIKVSTGEIEAKVTDNKDVLDELNNELNTLTQAVSAKITPEEVEIKISETLEKGVSAVSTSTGFTFDSDGLNITKSDSEISTLINEDGMRVSRGSEEVLTADNTGVNAINLTARQFLVIGENSRLEDFGSRTGCFWIGG